MNVAKYGRNLLVLAAMFACGACARSDLTVRVENSIEVVGEQVQLDMCGRRSVRPIEISKSSLLFKTKIDCEGILKLTYQEKSFDIGYVTSGQGPAVYDLSFDGNSITVDRFEISGAYD